MTNRILPVLFIFSLFVFSSCATYYKKTSKFQELVTSGKLEKARSLLEDDKKDLENRNRMLQLMNLGWVNFMLQEHEKSNEYFNLVDQMIEDLSKNYGKEALALISNPSIKPYLPEDFERIMPNFYKAINYIQLQQFENALVECRKINIKLNQLNDKFPDHKNKYQRDAFAHLLMGLVYDAQKEYNNAFIAYRNAYEIYTSDYVENFGIGAPAQLKQDLMRTAYLTGFNEELSQYEKDFKTKYTHQPNENGDLIFLWMNGFGPVKSEWSINFTKVDGQGGFVTLVNDEYGINFPFYIGDKPDNEKSAFAQLSFLRVAFPKYAERATVFNQAEIKIQNQVYPLETAENLNDIAFKCLHDRMLREMGTSLLRLATKKALEAAVRKEDQNAGAALGIINALTEKADTRNWQTLPYSISYSRIPLKDGTNQIDLNMKGQRDKQTINLSFESKKGVTQFFTYHSLESFPPMME
ncbi:MAG: hypothetical protein K9H64_05950 [Bacteroidales bacterium]|nr:hypothetical protein [Bacteroidales bacterium]MCF8455449.1 hypothetical protein [Bacteroidales bacterium]